MTDSLIVVLFYVVYRAAYSLAFGCVIVFSFKGSKVWRNLQFGEAPKALM